MFEIPGHLLIPVSFYTYCISNERLLLESGPPRNPTMGLLRFRVRFPHNTFDFVRVTIHPGLAIVYLSDTNPPLRVMVIQD